MGVDKCNPIRGILDSANRGRRGAATLHVRQDPGPMEQIGRSRVSPLARAQPRYASIQICLIAPQEWVRWACSAVLGQYMKSASFSCLRSFCYHKPVVRSGRLFRCEDQYLDTQGLESSARLSWIMTVGKPSNNLVSCRSLYCKQQA